MCRLAPHLWKEEDRAGAQDHRWRRPWCGAPADAERQPKSLFFISPTGYDLGVSDSWKAPSCEWQLVPERCPGGLGCHSANPPTCTAPGSSNRPVRAIGRRAWPILAWVIGEGAQFWIGRQSDLFGFGRRQPINVVPLGREAESIKRAGTLKRCRRISNLIPKLLAPELG